MVCIHKFESSFVLRLLPSKLSPRQSTIQVFVMISEELVNILPGDANEYFERRMKDLDDTKNGSVGAF